MAGLRSEFDQMLLDNAREKGAEVREQTEAVGLVRDGNRVAGVRAKTQRGDELTVGAQVTIDASGRSALAIASNRWRKWDPQLNKVAVWTYLRGAKRDPGLDEGSTTIAYLPEKNWFWYIPLAGDTVSVGIVAERAYLFGPNNDLPSIFSREVRKNPWIQDHLATSRQFGKLLRHQGILVSIPA